MLIVSDSLETIWVDILRTALIRRPSQFTGIATEIPASVRRQPFLAGDEAEDSSVSSG
jgi:hypothetical protein